jgi:hypothetical protein
MTLDDQMVRGFFVSSERRRLAEKLWIPVVKRTCPVNIFTPTTTTTQLQYATYPSTARWGTVPDAQPWWSSIKEAGSDEEASGNLVNSLREGVDNGQHGRERRHY